MKHGFIVAGMLSLTLGVFVSAQQPHGGPSTPLQASPNTNAAGGIVSDPSDPAALVRSDVLLQRQNETVVGASTRNPDHVLAAANDYRFVDFPDDPDFGGGQNFITRLIARLFRRPQGKPLPIRATGGPVGAWTGVYRSCDRGRGWIGSALPGSPLDNSPASLSSPLKSLSNLATDQGGHAETTDPVLVAGPGGRMHLVVLGFIRFPGGGVGESRMYYSSYTDRNNQEGGSCFNFDYTTLIDSSSAYIGSHSPSPFIDKPSIAVDKDGMLFVSYTVFLDAVKSQVVIARSSDGGATWTKTIPYFNLGFLRNHGTSTTIDPVRGTVYVAWRMFYDNWPMMVVSRSFDRGKTFWPATPISHWWPSKDFDEIVAMLKAARLEPFDQFSDPGGWSAAHATARALAFPSIVAGYVGGRSRLYAVWQERADVTLGSPTFGRPHADGSPRIMFSMSNDAGWTWTERRALDAGPQSNPQVQPVISLSGLTNPQLLVLYYQAQQEVAPPTGSNFISGIGRYVDVRSVRVSPLTGQLQGAPAQVAQYPIKPNSSPAAIAETQPGVETRHRPNLTMYAAGTKAFIGDYPALAPSTPFERDGSGWRWGSEPSSTLAMWTDNRDAQFPLNASGQADIEANWAAYVPVRVGSGAPPAHCGHVASRNANPYFSELAGVVAGSPQTFKRLNIQRAFVTYVENRTPVDRFFRLTLEPQAGIQASLRQFVPTLTEDVQIFGYSSRTQSVWVEPNLANETGWVRLRVKEIDGINGRVVASGHHTSLTLNPDPNNDALTNIPTQVGVGGGRTPDIALDELHNPQVSAPQVSALRIETPQVSAPQVSAPQVSAPQVSAPQVSAPQVAAPQVSAPQVSAPQVSAPQVSAPQVSAMTPDEQNGTDVTYTVTNVGNTETAYDALLNVPNVDALLTSGNYQFQVLITRTSLVPGFVQTAAGCVPAAETKVQVIANIQVPQVAAPQIAAIRNPQISAPQISALATFSVAPEGGAAAPVSSLDAQSQIVRDEVQITLRAIRLRPIATILAENGPVFDPRNVVLRVKSQPTNVVNEVVEADGTQPVARSSTTTVASGAAVAGFGAPLTLTATVTPAPAAGENGTVEFLDGATVIGSTPVNANGVATFAAQNLLYAIHSLSARFTGTTSVAPSTSDALTQHMARRFDTAAAFLAANTGDVYSEDFNQYGAGATPADINPIAGLLNVGSSFDTLQVSQRLFGSNTGERIGGRYDLVFMQPVNALAFEIGAQDPATSPARIELLTSVGSGFFNATNANTEQSNVFHGFVATLPLLGAKLHEGCEVGFPVTPTCLNEEITVDNVIFITPSTIENPEVTNPNPSNPTTTSLNLAPASAGTFRPGQSYNETRAIDVTVLPGGAITVSSMTLNGFSIGGRDSASVRARIWQGDQLIASAEPTVTSGGQVTIPISAVLAVDTSYRVGFYLATTPANGGSGTFIERTGATLQSFPSYAADPAGWLQVTGAWSTSADAYPTNRNIFVPQITIGASR